MAIRVSSIATTSPDTTLPMHRTFPRESILLFHVLELFGPLYWYQVASSYGQGCLEENCTPLRFSIISRESYVNPLVKLSRALPHSRHHHVALAWYSLLARLVFLLPMGGRRENTRWEAGVLNTWWVSKGETGHDNRTDTAWVHWTCRITPFYCCNDTPTGAERRPSIYSVEIWRI